MYSRQAIIREALAKQEGTAARLLALIEARNAGSLTMDPAYGIRSLTSDEHYRPGDIARPSYDWNFTEDRSTYGHEDEREIGTASIGIGDGGPIGLREVQEALDRATAYGGRELALLSSFDAQGGNDPYELDLSGASVMAVFPA